MNHSSSTSYSSTALAALCARTLDGLKAENVVALDLRAVESSPADFFVICSATSDVHARALNDALTRATVDVGERRPRSEGRDVGDWVLLDYFDVVVHIFRTEARDYYKLEKLWGDAPIVDFAKLAQEERARKKATKKETVKASTTRTPKTTKTSQSNAVSSSSRKSKSTKETTTTEQASDKQGALKQSASRKRPTTKSTPNASTTDGTANEATGNRKKIASARASTSKKKE